MKIILSALTAATMAASWGANATLEPRLNGQAYYDTESDLTWTADVNINGSKTIDEQLSFLSTFIIDGIGGWRIPNNTEINDIAFKNSDCSQITICLPIGPFNTDDWGGSRLWFQAHATTDGQGYSQMYAHGSDGKYYFAVSLFWAEYYPAYMQGNSGTFAIWPVHTGDVAAISQVPEPGTYAMLLAGLGLIGFIGRRKNAIKL